MRCLYRTYDYAYVLLLTYYNTLNTVHIRIRKLLIVIIIKTSIVKVKQKLFVIKSIINEYIHTTLQEKSLSAKLFHVTKRDAIQLCEV